MTENSQTIRFYLNIGYDQYLAFYQGQAESVVAKTEDGRNLQFPAGNIQRFLTTTGVQGHFEMTLTSAGKFLAIKKLD